MSMNVLSVVGGAMEKAGLTYDFMERNLNEDESPAYPYWIGEYQEHEPLNEDGLTESTFMLTGYHRGNWLQLEIEKEKIKKELFPLAGGLIVTMEDGSVVAVFYAGATVIPTGDAELKRIEISLRVKEWRVI